MSMISAPSDAVWVDGLDPEFAVSELAMNDVQRHALAGHLDGACVTQPMRREAPPRAAARSAAPRRPFVAVRRSCWRMLVIGRARLSVDRGRRRTPDRRGSGRGTPARGAADSAKARLLPSRIAVGSRLVTHYAL